MSSDSRALLIILIFILVGLSAFFSSAETAYSSLNKIRIKNLAADGNKKAKKVLELSDSYDILLSTILIGNNIVNIASTSIATLVFTGFFGEDLGVTLSTVFMTIFVLIFGEITPKSIAKEKAEGIALAFAAPLKACIIILTPVNFLFKHWKKFINKIFHLDRNDSITEEELITYVDEAQSGGEINSDEGELIRSAIEFNDLDVSDVLTPRVDIVAVDKSMSISEIAKVFEEDGYSRLPVYDEDIDHIVGIIHERDFRRVQDKKLKSIRTILKNVPYVSENMKISVVLRMLQKKKTHLAVVVDEFGGTAGIITLEDIIEELVGEIWDEYDEVVEELIQNEDGTYTVNCNCSLEKFAEEFNFEAEDYDVASVGGWVMSELEKIPEKGDHFEFDNRLLVTVTEVESRRASIIKVEIIGEKDAVQEQ